jgi:hypothetical protein
MSIVKADVCVKTQSYFKLMYHTCGLDVCATVVARLCNYKQEIAYGPELDHSGLQNTTFTVIHSDLYDKEKCTGNFIYIKRSYSKALSTPGT